MQDDIDDAELYRGEASWGFLEDAGHGPVVHLMSSKPPLGGLVLCQPHKEDVSV